MRRRALIGALLLIVAGVALGATVFRTDIAQATGLAQAVTVDNTAANPVPVRERNLDANGDIKVHEQGAVRVRPAAAITGGGSAVSLPGGGDLDVLGGPATATALSIHMSAGVSFTVLEVEGVAGDAALFYGPANDGNASIVLALTRPIQFDHVRCAGASSERCSVSWVGNEP
jgi:hypothetical protein